MILFAVLLVCFVVAPTLASADPISLAISTALGGGFFAGVVSSFIVKAAVAVGLSLVAQAFQKKPSSIQQNSIQTTVTSSGGVQPQKFIVGKYATAGHRVAPPKSHSSVGNQYKDILNYVIELGNIKGATLNRVIVDSKASAPGAYDGNFGNALPALFAWNPVAKQFINNGYIRYYDGTQGVADPLMVDKYGSDAIRPWTNFHIGRGSAYAVLSFVYNPELFKNGLPEVRFEMLGIPLYDPRKDSTAGGSGAQRWTQPSTWTYSANPVVIVYNIMRGIRLHNGEIWGGEIDEEDLPYDNWRAAMSACDTLIGSRPAFRAGFEIDVVNNEPAEVIEELLKVCLGQITEFGGVFRVRVGAPAVPTYSISDDDIIITEPQELDPFPGIENTYNAVNGTYVEPKALWESSEANPYFNAEWEAEDDNRRLPLNLSFPAAYVKSQVQHLMRAYIRDNRRFIVHSIVLPPDAAILEPLDTLAWTSDRNGYISKVFEVISVRDMPFSLNQFLTIRERSPDDYDWTADDDVPEPDDVTGDDEVGTLQAVGLTVTASEQLVRETVAIVATLEVTAANPEFIDRVEVQYKLSTDSEWITHATGSIGFFQLVDLESKSYDFRARGFAFGGAVGDWVYVYDFSAASGSSPPANVDELNAIVTGGQLMLDWDAISDVDLSHYKIRHSAEGGSPSWANATTVVEKVSRPASQWSVPARAGSFHIKAFDKSGLTSEVHTTAVVPSGDIRPYANSLTLAEHPGFSGTKTGCSVISTDLRITDPSVGPTEAEYEFSTYIDTGGVRRFRARIDAVVARHDNSAGLWDDIPGNWDDFPGIWDDWTGDAQFADTDVLFFIATTDDDPTGSPTWSDWRRFRVGDFSGWAAKFKITMKSASSNVTPSIDQLTAFVEYD